MSGLVSKKSSKHVSNSNPTKAHAAAREVETTSSTVLPATPTAPPSALTAMVTETIQGLGSMETALNLNIVVPPNDRSQMLAMNRVSNVALGIASDIVASDPTRLEEFSGLAASAAYVETMTPLADCLEQFAGHVRNSILNQQSPAAQQTLVLYSIVKGLGRMVSNQTMRENIGKLKAELVPKRSGAAPKQTNAQRNAKAVAKRMVARVAKARALLAANDPASLASTATPEPAAAAASPTKAATSATPASPPVTGLSAPITPTAS